METSQQVVEPCKKDIVRISGSRDIARYEVLYVHVQAFLVLECFSDFRTDHDGGLTDTRSACDLHSSSWSENWRLLTAQFRFTLLRILFVAFSLIFHIRVVLDL